MSAPAESPGPTTRTDAAIRWSIAILVVAQAAVVGLQVIGRLRGDAALLSAAQALEQAFEAVPTLRRPRPDLDALRTPRPELKSIVTHPPLLAGGSTGAGLTAV